ncbi:MAG: MFS transporter [Alphaproteobacteria bacterium]|nr:MFS transporter [Alphaproteobacteria bacterium]
MDTADGLPWPQRLWSIVTIAVAVSMSMLDTTIANVALPTIAENLHASAASSVWVVNAYQLAVMLLVLPLASIGDIHGYRRVYMAGLSIFTVTSLLCAISFSLPMLAMVRALQGVGAACLFSVNAALLRATYPRAMLGRGLGINAFVIATSAAAGPTVAGGILAIASWRWLFMINVPLGLVALALAVRSLPPSRRAPQHFDYWSALLSALAFGLLITAIDGLGHGEKFLFIGGEFAAALIFGALFAWRQTLIPFPMLPVTLFARPIFTLSVITSICSFIAQALALVSMPFYFEHALGLSDVQTGLLITPWPLTIAVVAPIAGRLSDRLPVGLMGGIGLAIMAVGLAMMARLQPHPAVLDVVWRMVVCGFGFGFFQSPNNRAIIASTPRERSGSAGAIISTARLLGQTTGTACVALIFGLAVSRGANFAILLGAGFAAGAAAISFLRLMNRVPPEREART